MKRKIITAGICVFAATVALSSVAFGQGAGSQAAETSAVTAFWRKKDDKNNAPQKETPAPAATPGQKAPKQIVPKEEVQKEAPVENEKEAPQETPANAKPEATPQQAPTPAPKPQGTSGTLVDHAVPGVNEQIDKILA